MLCWFFLLLVSVLCRVINFQGPVFKDKTLFQSCHILHKQGRYYIVHFKELFALDDKYTDFTEEDKGRRNTIAGFLEEWNLFKIINREYFQEPKAPPNQIKILTYKEKDDYELVAKYTIGKKKRI